MQRARHGERDTLGLMGRPPRLDDQEESLRVAWRDGRERLLWLAGVVGARHEHAADTDGFCMRHEHARMRPAAERGDDLIDRNACRLRDLPGSTSPRPAWKWTFGNILQGKRLAVRHYGGGSLYGCFLAVPG